MELWHRELIKDYGSGSASYQIVIDRPYAPAQPEWDEYEEVMRYIEYTPEELKSQKIQQEQEARIPNLEKENKLLAQKIEALYERNEFLEDCIAEIASVIYA